MTWNIIREETMEDTARYTRTKMSFIKRYGIDPDTESFEDRHVEMLWKKRVQRALRSPQATGIAYGMVGYHSKSPHPIGKEINTMQKPKRKITPHKGGRDKRVEIRLTAAELAALDEARGTMSRSDWIAEESQKEIPITEKAALRGINTAINDSRIEVIIDGRCYPTPEVENYGAVTSVQHHAIAIFFNAERGEYRLREWYIQTNGNAILMITDEP